MDSSWQIDLAKVEALYEATRDIFDRKTDDELLAVPWCLFCDHGEDDERDFDARALESELCEWLLIRRGRVDLLSQLYTRWEPLIGPLTLSGRFPEGKRCHL